ncbi:class I SAM-dependent methyltransferase [Candidatus Bathyarchaeota archaeon]|nr:class I SAM-dependent methyltransferase [Candidatus Bathyarchaeota archaeon]
MSKRKHFDEGTMRKWHHPEIGLESMGLHSGMTFMDVGCGYGFFTIPAARIVGKTGKVYAVDIDASSIDLLKRAAAEEGLNNIRAKVGAAEETVFCEGCADIVFYSIVLHDFRDPVKVLLNAKLMLKLNGKMINLDWKKKSTTLGPPLQIRFSEEQASRFIKQAGFTVESIRDLESDFYLITAKPFSHRNSLAHNPFSSST